MDEKVRERYGLHRVLAPPLALPQAAQKLDPSPDRVVPGELVLSVDLLNVDSASFRQLEEACGGDLAGVGRAIEAIVKERGKLENPVTGSGGMLLGRVSEKSSQEGLARFGVRIGDRVATLVSLTLTPLRIDRILGIDGRTHQVQIEGEAILLPSGILSRMPTDLPERLALAALDVAGAAPQVTRLLSRWKPSARVLILGCGGKSGLLCSAAAKRAGARIVGIEANEAAAKDARRLEACERIELADARSPVAVLEAAGAEFDLVVSCVNVEAAEMSAILCVRDGGTIYFFSMATSFSRAALGAEGISRDVDMLIGNGYCPGHAETTLTLLREEPALRKIFEERYG